MAPRSNKKKGRKAPKSNFTEEQRTPKKLKAAEPDCTVVVGGEEFHHYKILLCSGSDFFDTMLSNEMRETEESRVEFPDKDPNEWLQVYAFIDPQGKKPEITHLNAMALISWFDYLGMKEQAEKCDIVFAESLHSCEYDDLSKFSKDWNDVKAKPCPVSQKKVLTGLNCYFQNYKYGNLLGGGLSVSEANTLKKLIRDEIGGERVWKEVRSVEHLSFPRGIASVGRVELVENPLFDYLLRMCHIDMRSLKH